MRKWNELQFVIVIVINIVSMTIVIAGEILSGLYFLYKTELYTCTISTLVLSGVVMILGDLYSKRK